MVKRRQNEVSQIEGADAGQFVREVAVLGGVGLGGAGSGGERSSRVQLEALANFALPYSGLSAALGRPLASRRRSKSS